MSGSKGLQVHKKWDSRCKGAKDCRCRGIRDCRCRKARDCRCQGVRDCRCRGVRVMDALPGDAQEGDLTLGVVVDQ